MLILFSDKDFCSFLIRFNFSLLISFLGDPISLSIPMAIPIIINNIIAFFGDSMNSMILYNESMVRNVLVNVLENDIAPLSALPIRYITPEIDK